MSTICSSVFFAKQLRRQAAPVNIGPSGRFNHRVTNIRSD
jgi:hypothetical protein